VITVLIKSIRVRNFRSIADEVLECDRLTALVGPNSCGKSAFLRALELFYSPTPRIDPEDYYNGDVGSELAVAVTFTELSPEALELFAPYIQGDTLTVERVFRYEDGKPTPTAKYHGARMQHSEFQSIRAATTAAEKKSAYELLRKRPEYSSLPPWANQGAAADALADWELAHLDQCTRERDDGQFFGFKDVGRGYLGRFTRLLTIPAVRDATEDASEGRNSALTDLMDMFVRKGLTEREDLVRLKQETQQQYEAIMGPGLKAMTDLVQNEISATLETFVPNAKVDVSWSSVGDVSIPVPRADMRLVEDGYPSSVGRTGHGVQRALIITMLQHLAVAHAKESEDKAQEGQEHQLPDFVLTIEEPELYQHPSRQRHVARVLHKLASGSIPGVADRTQILYTTHSPYFIGLDRINQIRLLRKVPNGPGKPKVTKIVSCDLDKVAAEIWRAAGEPQTPFTGDSLMPRLESLMTPWMNEGFFADVVVLVEGEDDRAVILGVAQVLGYDLESMGFSVIPCGGKNSLDRPAAIFRHLGIPVYVIWDGDKGKTGKHKPKPEDNHLLLRLMGREPVDWPPCMVEAHFACFETDLETTLKYELGEDVFERCLEKCQQDYGFPEREHAKKKPIVFTALMKEASREGKESGTLKCIIENIVALRP